MNDDENYARHLKFYLFALAFGCAFAYWGYKAHWLPFIFYGACISILSFIGIIFFCEDGNKK